MEIYKYFIRDGIIKQIPNYIYGGWLFEENNAKRIIYNSNRCKPMYAYYWGVRVFEEKK